MSRFTRLNKLIAEIRRLPSPVTAQVLADATGVSERTIYRDIETLRQSGAVIDGEAGFGYTMSEDPALPPFSFSRTEVEAIVLGLQSVGEIADVGLAQAAQAALTKLSARLPERARAQISHAILDAKSFSTRPEITVDQGLLRSAAWEERALDLSYRDSLATIFSASSRTCAQTGSILASAFFDACVACFIFRLLEKLSCHYIGYHRLTSII